MLAVAFLSTGLAPSSLRAESPATEERFDQAPASNDQLSYLQYLPEGYADDPGKIVIACVGRRRGHPIIVPGTLIEFVRSSAADGGLNAVPHAHADRVRTVPCHSAGVVRDVDTPEDYRRLGP